MRYLFLFLFAMNAYAGSPIVFSGTSAKFIAPALKTAGTVQTDASGNISIGGGGGGSSCGSSGVVCSATIDPLCHFGPCTISNQTTGFLASVAEQATGDYLITYNTSGMFGSADPCWAEPFDQASTAITTSVIQNLSATHSEIQFRNAATGNGIDVKFKVYCAKP